MRTRSIMAILALALMAGSLSAALGEDAVRDRRARQESRERRFREMPRGWGGRGEGGGCHGVGLYGGLITSSDLALDQERKEAVIELLTAGFRDSLKARAETREAALALYRMREDGNADGEAVVSAHAALGSARGRLEAIRFQTRRDILNVIGPELAEKLDAETGEQPGDCFGRGYGWGGRGDRGGRGGRGGNWGGGWGGCH